MTSSESYLFGFFTLLWIFGIAVAEGFWLTAISVICPPVGWVLFARWMMEIFFHA